MVFYTFLKDATILGNTVKKNSKGDAVEMIYFTIASSSRPRVGKLFCNGSENILGFVSQ